MYAKTIISCSLPYAWQEAVRFVSKSNQDIIFGGVPEIKRASDSQVQIILDKHAIEDALNHVVHPSDPFCTHSDGTPSEERIMTYVKEYEDNFDASEFSYTYWDEMRNGFGIDLIIKIMEGLEFQITSTYVDKEGKTIKGLSSNRNVITLFNNTKWNMMSSSPCWNILWIRFEKIDEDGTVWVSISTWYRSHDLTDAWESNFIAQVTMIVNKILKPLEEKLGLKIKILDWHESNASLHIYVHNLPTAEKLKTVSINPILRRLQDKYDLMVKS